jgi:predicted nucleic acid-binding Zn ribbon protein
MPTYEFTCMPCDRTLTITCAHDELKTIACDCGEFMKRSYNFGAVTFNGSGFYKTDK